MITYEIIIVVQVLMLLYLLFFHRDGVIPLDFECPEWTNYIAFDGESNEWWAYENEPVLERKEMYDDPNGGRMERITLVMVNR